MISLASRCALAVAIIGATPAPGYAETKLETIREHLAKSEQDKAYPLLVELVGGSDTEGDAYLYLGVIERERGHLPKAIAAFEKGLSRKTQHRALILELAITYAWLERFDDALDMYDHVLDAEPTHRGAMLGRARVLAWAGRNQDATDIYTVLLAKDPSDSEALRGQAFVYRSQLELTQAKALYKRVLRDDPSDPEALAGLREVETTTRWQAELALGGFRSQGDGIAPQGSAALLYRYDASTTLFTRWQAASTSLLDPSSVDGLATNNYQASIGLRHRRSDRVNLALGYVVRDSGQASVHAVQFAANLRFSERWVVDLGLRPGISTTGGVEALAVGGLQYLAGESAYLMAQLFHNRSASVTTSSTAVATLGISPWKRLDLRMSAGKGILGDRDITSFALALGTKLSNTQSLFLRSEVTVEPFARQSLTLGAVRTF